MRNRDSGSIRSRLNIHEVSSSPPAPAPIAMTSGSRARTALLSELIGMLDSLGVLPVCAVARSRIAVFHRPGNLSVQYGISDSSGHRQRNETTRRRLYTMNDTFKSFQRRIER